LDVKQDDEIYQALQTVRLSRSSERVKTYSEVKGISTSQEIAVVIQKLVRAEISGVLFTADPVTGSRNKMMGNFVYGLGEKLVSGEADAESFTFALPKGKYEGPEILSKFTKRLYKLATKLEKDLGGPQDIEWAIAEGKVYILQTRPITTLIAENPQTGEWNDSKTGDYLWVNGGLGENLPEVMTPATWSLWKIFFLDMLEWSIGDHKAVGNIGGRPYINMSLVYSFVIKARGEEVTRKHLTNSFGHIPNIDIPLIPMTWKDVLTQMTPGEIKWQKMVKEFAKEISEFIAVNPQKCLDLQAKIKAAKTPEALSALWTDEIKPAFIRAGYMLKTINEKFINPWTNLKTQLEKLVGENVDVLMSTLGSGEQLASLSPMVGLSKIHNGEMSKEEYLLQYGHRGPNEWHLSKPRPNEDPQWLEKQLKDYEEADIDLDAMLKERISEHETAWKHFAEHYPKKVKSVQKQIATIAKLRKEREEIRSEITRSVAVVRDYFLQAGELTGLNDDIFFLYIDELLEVLSGNKEVLATIPARKETHQKYETLPPYPMAISGRFDPFLWAADPKRRMDVYDAHTPYVEDDQSYIVTGNPGASGRVEGTARIIHRPEDGDRLLPGEILVTTTTNVGWTPLFPKAAAVVTDVGMPLAHASIVARELGIPAVVGCGNATLRIHDGDRIIVDGSHGRVEILNGNQ
jgi:pyruvate,water dikinase